MSKKHRRKHYSETNSNTANSVAVTSSVASAVSEKESSVYSAHREEYKHITSDLIRVVVVNGLFLIGVLILYYINRSHPFLDSWYNSIF